MLEANVTLVGNLVDNADLQVTAAGVYRCTFRIASTPRRYDRHEDRWVDGSPLFIRVACWRRLAEHVAASVNRGTRVIVLGRLRQSSYESAEGQKRTRFEVEADAVGLELAWHPAKAARAQRPAPTDGEPGEPSEQGEADGPVGVGEPGLVALPGGADARGHAAQDLAPPDAAEWADDEVGDDDDGIVSRAVG